MGDVLVRYVSTRGEAPELGFSDVLLAGLARDGGLYVPSDWPQLDEKTIKSFAGKPYADVAFEVIKPFVGGEIADSTLKTMVDEAYASFRHRAVTPLVEIGPEEWVLELFHGPTLAFKDVAMQLLGRLMDHVLGERGQRATIVGATSGDTGGAAIDAFRGRDNVDIFIMFPDGRVSPVQRRQMTTIEDRNVHAIAVEGTFDDCQAIVKGCFNHHAFRDRVSLAGVNSINWARVMAQIVYYFTSAVAVGAPHRPISFTVPTGNFGDIFAGYVAMQMGLPVDRLVVATNENDILTRAMDTGSYEMRGVKATISPSMDIQISSNFERLLFEAYNRDGDAIDTLMQRLGQARRFEITDDALMQIRSDFAAGRADEDEVRATIRTVREESNYLLDTHTAIGVAVGRKHVKKGVPMIVLGTAHPAKFPDAVEEACGYRPPLPLWAEGMMSKEEKFSVLPNDQAKVEAFIEEHSRAVGMEV
ncbi:threonine synthase [Coralliovum pocilloporae]|uniref:threonine synthase n=1 Tax=Coralliovum pocilloporae TaxID=3066369 RepID=UPI003306B559